MKLFTLFITEMKSVYSAVRTASLNETFYAFYNWDEKYLQRGTNWSLNETFYAFYNRDESVYSAVRTASLNETFYAFYNRDKNVYSAVRTGSLNKAVCTSSVWVNCDLPLKKSFPLSARLSLVLSNVVPQIYHIVRLSHSTAICQLRKGLNLALWFH